MGNHVLRSLLSMVALSVATMAQPSAQQSTHNQTKANKSHSSRKQCLHIASIRHLLTGPIKRPQPEYPEAARRKGINGAVDVLVYVTEEGKVSSAVVCKGNPLLRQAALNAAYQAEFEPVKYEGKSVKSVTMLTYVFPVEQKKAKL
jgi:TonB family protein